MELSEGCLEPIMNGQQIADPIMQVFGCKKVSGQQGRDKYRLLLSDGKYCVNFGMLASQINYRADELIPYSIIKLTRYVTSVLQSDTTGNKKVLILLDLDVLMPGDEVGKKIGNAVPLPSITAPQANQAPTTASKPVVNRSSSSINSMETTRTTSTTHAHIAPIESLNPYQPKWTIRARVTAKAPMRTWSNARGEGRLFSVDLMDASGEIRATAFNDEADAFYERLQVDKVYLISNGQLKVANKKWNLLKNDYEMSFNRDTEIEDCYETINLPMVTYNFVDLDKVCDTPLDQSIDVIGVCVYASPINEFTSKNGKLLKKREVNLVDETMKPVCLVLWGNEAETFDGDNNPVVVIKNARLSEFRDVKSLSCLGSNLKINPDIPEAHRLRGWYDNVGSNQIDASFKQPMQYQPKMRMLTLAESQMMGTGDQTDYFSFIGHVVFIKPECVYKACGNGECKRKVLEVNGSEYSCPGCNIVSANFKYMYVLSVQVADAFDTIWATCFSETATLLLGKTANEMGQLLVDDNEAALVYLASKNFKMYEFKLAVKMERYNDEARKRINIIRVEPVNVDTALDFYLGKLEA